MTAVAPQARTGKGLYVWGAIGSLTLVAAGAVAGHFWSTKRTPAQRSVAIVVSGDTGGWIMPCGCTANQSGGLLRRATHVRQLAANADILYVDAGGAAGGTSAYQKVKFEAILTGELAMGLAAHNLGAPEVELEAEYLRALASQLRVPFVSANLRDQRGERIAEPIRFVECGSRRFAIVGVLSPRYRRDGIHIDDPREAVLQAIAKQKYDSLLVLAYLPEEELRKLAEELPEADLVIGGPTGQSLAPRRVGPTWVASATNKGKFLVQFLAGPRQRTPEWDGAVVEMGPSIPDDPDQEVNLRKYLTTLEQKDFPAGETGYATALPAPDGYRIAGSQSCQSCHKADCTLWEGSKHAHAWATLAGRGFQVDPFCQQCHTTGYGLPGGFVSVGRSPQARAVGCESCHGPSDAHAKVPTQKTSFAAHDQCVRCHDRENSPQFSYASYWERIGHGKKSPAPKP